MPRLASARVALTLVLVWAAHAVTAQPVINGTTNIAHAPLLADGVTYTSLSSLDGPVLFRVQQTADDVSAVIRVEDRQVSASSPIALVYAYKGTAFQTSGAFKQETRENPALLDVSVCDFSSGDWVIGVEYKFQTGLSSTNPTRRIFDIRFHTESSWSCEFEETLMFVGLPALLLVCAIAVLICVCCYRKKQKQAARQQRDPNSTINDHDFDAVVMQSRGLRRELSSRREPSLRNRNSVSLADQMAQLAAAQEAQRRAYTPQPRAAPAQPQWQTTRPQAGGLQGMELPPVYATGTPPAPSAPVRVAHGVYRA